MLEDTHQKMKRQLRELKTKNLKIIYLTRDLYLEYIKNAYNSIKIQITIFKNGQKI